VCQEGNPGMVALLGLLSDELAGVASYELTSDEVSAEIAFGGRRRQAPPRYRHTAT